VQGGPGVQGQAGVDVVFDMTNLQAATFGYKGVGAAASISVGASAYAGYGFGDKKGVIDAWSGRFCSAGASINLPAKFLSAGASAFMSPDGSVYGAAVSVGAGVGLPAAQLGDISAFASDWTAWNGGTEAISQNGFLINQKIVKDADGHEYIQYASPKDMALALLFDAPMPLGATAAAQVIALDLQKKSGLTIEQMCPAQAAAAGPPPVVKAVGNACDAIPSVDKLVQGAKNIITPPSPPTNIVNGDAGPPIKDTCVGKADGIYCSELAAFSAIQCCNHSICGGQQCAGGTSAKCVGPNGPGTMIVCQ
jgi:hypothetical protein